MASCREPSSSSAPAETPGSRSRGASLKAAVTATLELVVSDPPVALAQMVAMLPGTERR